LLYIKECEFRYNTKTAQKLISKTVEINKKQQDEVVDKIRLSFVESFLNKTRNFMFLKGFKFRQSICSKMQTKYKPKKIKDRERNSLA